MEGRNRTLGEGKWAVVRGDLALKAQPARKSQPVLRKQRNHFQKKHALENNNTTASKSNSLRRDCEWQDSTKGWFLYKFTSLQALRLNHQLLSRPVKPYLLSSSYQAEHNVFECHLSPCIARKCQRPFNVCGPLNMNHRFSSTQSLWLLKLVATQQMEVGNFLLQLYCSFLSCFLR